MAGGKLQSLSTLLRPRGQGHTRVTYVELFFDLVFVFAITQVSHFLLHHLTPVGLAQTTFLMLAVWTVWIHACWTTNWLNPQATPVRILLFALMLAGLIISSSLPEAFAERGLAFAGAYVFMQVVRTAFVMLSMRGHDANNHRNFQRILIWLTFSGVFWIAGGLAEGPARWALWGLALTLESASPALGFWVPGMGRSQTTDWNVAPEHFAERCALFIIIALGESLLVTGATFAEIEWTLMAFASFGVAFLGTVAMWWLYFSIAVEDASFEFERSDDPGRVARLAYTYLHIPLVAGIILTAVGDEIVLNHHGGRLGVMDVVCILGGPVVFLAGNLVYKRVMFGEYLQSHIAGLALLVAMTVISPIASPLALSAITTGILILVGRWENQYAKKWKAMNPDWRVKP